MIVLEENNYRIINIHEFKDKLEEFKKMIYDYNSPIYKDCHTALNYFQRRNEAIIYYNKVIAKLENN